MSDSKDSIVTYTAVSSPFGGLSDIGSPGVNGPPVMPEDPYAYVIAAFQAPPSPDYVPGPEEPEHAPLSPEFVPEPVYPEFMPPEDDVLSAEEKPLSAAVSPRYDDEDDNDDVEEDEDEDEEEGHPALANSIPPLIARLLAIPTPPPSPLSPWSSPPPQISSPPVPVSPPPLPASPTYPLGYRAGMIRLRAEAPSTSYPLPLPSPIVLPHTRAFVAIMRVVVPSTYILAYRSEAPPLGTPPLLPIPLPTPSLPLLLPSTDRRADVREVCLPPRKRLCFALGLRYEASESSSAPTARPTGGFRADYGFVATLDDEIKRDPKRDVGSGITETWDEMLVDILGAPATDETELGRRLTNFVTIVRQDIDEIYRRLDDAHDARSLMSGRLNMLFRDRRTHAHTALLMEREFRLSREAWRRSMDASDLVRSEVLALCTQVVAQQSEIAGLWATYRTRQAQLAETLRLMSTLQTQ
ncbi:hypothetical protein Tco_0092484, partial [Tanacetum coccineum]